MQRWVYRRPASTPRRRKLPVSLYPVASGGSVTVNADNAAIAYIPLQYTDSGGQRELTANSAEVWFRIYGDSLTCEYRSSGTGPFSISVDGGAWWSITGAFVNTSGGTATSGEMLPGGTPDGWHDIRLKVNGSYGIYFVITGGITVGSASNNQQITTHSQYGAHEAIRGSHGLAYWSDSFSDNNASASYTPVIFPTAKPSGGTALARECYCKFLVDGDTTQMFPYMLSDGGNDWRYSVWVDGTMISRHAPLDVFTLGSPLSPVPIPGSGTREVVICNFKGLYGITVDGGFVTTAVSQPAKKLLAIGDSVSSGDSCTIDYHAITWYLQDFMIRGSAYKYKNAGLSGDTVIAATTANRVDNDYAPCDPDIVVCNYGINDSARWTSDFATVQAEYEAFFNDILTTFPTAKLYAVPPIGYTTVSTGIAAAVTAVASARCIFIDSSTWAVSSDLKSGAHPTTLGYGQGYGSGVVEFTANPDDGDTVTIDGIVYEFDDDASVTGANVSVTIGADRDETSHNLSVAIQGQGQSVLIEMVDISGAANGGVVIPGVATLSKSATNVRVYLESAGWRDAFGEMFPSFIAAWAVRSKAQIFGGGIT